ncbi:porin family protein [Flavobacterium sp.]|uniref:porin family protein n=1 Tax=Flavobacterium sp. TaxID=239 RepID=UPI00260EBCF4|nr:porin family protein [Flavobacterium sp.]
MRFYLSILTLFLSLSVLAQEEVVEKKILVDSLYREDQFYLNFTYNTLQNLEGINQSKFSSGFCIGFLRDMPVNKSRTIAFATGLGYSLNIYNDNLYQNKIDVNGVGNQNSYELLTSDVFFDKNKTSLHYLDLPIEFRWRSSTPESHRFWRIYTGFKLSYLISDRYKFVNDVQTKIYKSNADLNKFQYGCYMAAGWNTWNFYAYYGLSPIYKSAKINGENIKLSTFNLGLQFYIL